MDSHPAVHNTRLPQGVAASDICDMAQSPDESDTGALTDLQMAVIAVLWEAPGASLSDVTSALNADRSLAPTTVATLLSRLEVRGAIRREGSARAFRYFAVITRSEARRDAMRRVRNTLFGGDSKEVMAHLINESPLSPDEAEYLRNLIDSAPAVAKDSTDSTAPKRRRK